ncbi:MAG: glycoside hydrolase family 32 protein [Firmicutes bacterium]|nr:glycoside hydrolase family 32 protein [Bacillota bacterium]
MSELLNKANEYERLNKNKVDEQRPLFHLTGGVGWINDPNGFSFYKDEYHMFYQYYPFDTYFGPMFWGHAVSKDLLNWIHKGAVMAPDTFYDEKGCFSGTAIQIGNQHALFYTGVDGKNNQQQVIAFGDGRTYSKYE